MVKNKNCLEAKKYEVEVKTFQLQFNPFDNGLTLCYMSIVNCPAYVRI